MAVIRDHVSDVTPPDSSAAPRETEEMTVSDSPALPAEERSARPQVARVAETGTIGGDRSRPMVRVQPLRDLMRRRQIQQSFLDPCAAFHSITRNWVEEHDFCLTDEDSEFLAAPDQQVLMQGGFVWLAISGQDAAGAVALLRRTDVDAMNSFSAPEGAAAWELTCLGVGPEWRRQGVATILVEALLRQYAEVARAGDVLFLELPQALAAATDVFGRVGFQEVTCQQPLAKTTRGLPLDVRMVYSGNVALRAKAPEPVSA
mmetsp:Transcript_104495/g.207556  ORF Transcript_104495/g.207556 Transcript_104495/m.207556 type:complete len:260 (-) Transcript_104495:73-852(-)